MGYPYLVSLNLDEFMIVKPAIMNSDLDDHDQPLIKNLIISAEKINIMQNPSSSSSSSSSWTPIIHENPNTKPAHNAVWNNQIQNPLNYTRQIGDHLRNIGEDFLQNPAPLMTKIDQEYLNWQQQQQEQEMMDSMQAQTVVGSDFRVFDENKVTTTQLVVENSSCEKNKSNNDLMKDEMRVKSVERRQRRMIKNRESAARSRARKQVIN